MTFESVKFWSCLAFDYAKHKVIDLFCYFFSLGKAIPVNKKYLTVGYRRGTETYNMLIPVHRGPSDILSIEPEEASKFSGPFKNFYNLKITPKDLGLKYVKINFHDGRVSHFIDDQHIHI